MYAVFAEHCTKNDLRAANNDGWTVLFCMAVTFTKNAKATEQARNFADVMCDVVQCLGPRALRAETRDNSYHNRGDIKYYPAGSTTRSVLRAAGGKGRSLLQRLEAAAARLDAAGAEKKTEKDAPPRAHVTPQPAPASASAEAKQAPAATTTTRTTGSETKGSADTPADPAAATVAMPAAAVPASEGKKDNTDEEEEEYEDDVWAVNPWDVDGPPQEEFNKIILLRMDNKMEAITGQMRTVMQKMQGVKDMVAGHDDTAQSRRLPQLIEIVRDELTPADLESEAEVLGGGGAADVYLGHYGGTNVAIKKMRLSVAQLRQGDSNTDVYRMKREARILQLTGHPNIIRCMGACLEGGEALLVLEHAELGSVHDILQRPAAQRPLCVDADCKRQWVIDIASALLYIHHMDIIHRDVKPANFLVMRNGRIKLADFGLARYEDNRTRQTAREGGGAVGTWAYLALELLRVARGQMPPYSKASDVYALAISIMEIVMEECWLPATATFTDIQSRVCDAMEHPQVPPISDIPGPLLSVVAVAEKAWHPIAVSRPTISAVVKLLQSDIVPGGQDEGKQNEAKAEQDQRAEVIETLFSWLSEHVTSILRPNARHYAEAMVAANVTNVDRLVRTVQRDADALSPIIPDDFDREDVLAAVRRLST